MKHKKVSRHKQQRPQACSPPTRELTEAQPPPATNGENAHGDDGHASEEFTPAPPSRFWKNPNHWIAIATVVIALANGIYTFFALQQWGAMQESNRISREALQVSQRAYLSLGKIQFNLTNGLWHIPINNTGHLPSQTVFTDVIVTEFNISDRAAKTLFHATFGDDGTKIPPGENYMVMAFKTPLSIEQRSDITAGRKQLSIGGLLTYGTGFGKTRDDFPFCFSYDPDPTINWSPCRIRAGSDADKKFIEQQKAKQNPPKK